MCKLSPVAFHGDTIFCIDYYGEPHTPMKPIIENIGMDWATQFRKLKSNPKRWGIVIMTIPSESGDQETLTMPVRKLAAWLNTIHINKVKAELRPKIELYQNESDDALWNYWMEGKAERKDAANGTLTPAARAELKALVDAKLSTYPASVQGKARAEIWARFNRKFRVAEYAQLPMKKLDEARDFLVEMEVKALKEAARQKELPQSRPLFPSGIVSNIPGPQPGDKYYAYLEKVERWRVATVAERKKLYREGVALLDVERTGGQIFHVCADFLTQWLNNEVLSSNTSVFDELLSHNRAPVVLIKFLNTNFEDVRKYLK